MDNQWHHHVLFEVAVHLGIHQSESLGKAVGHEEDRLQACRAMGKLFYKQIYGEHINHPVYFVETILKNRMQPRSTTHSPITPLRLIQIEVPVIDRLADHCRYGLRCQDLSFFC